MKQNKYIILEIFQISLILFISALIASFIMSNIFTKLDTVIDENLDYDSTGYTITKFTEVFLQLFLTTILYFYLEEMLYYIPSISSFIKSSYTPYKTAKYAIHIVMIVVLVELNTSLKHGIHYLADKIMIVH